MRIFSFLACSFLLPCALVMGGISGTYNVHGKNPDGSTYSGTLEIEKAGEIYTSHWALSDGSSVGTGVKKGDCLAFDFVGVDNLGNPIVGVQLYKISHDELEGPWSINGTGFAGSERDVKIHSNHSHSSSR